MENTHPVQSVIATCTLFLWSDISTLQKLLRFLPIREGVDKKNFGSDSDDTSIQKTSWNLLFRFTPPTRMVIFDTAQSDYAGT